MTKYPVSLIVRDGSDLVDVLTGTCSGDVRAPKTVHE